MQNKASGEAFNSMRLPIEASAARSIHSGLKEEFLPFPAVIEERGLVFCPIAPVVAFFLEMPPGVKKRERRRVAATEGDDRLKPDFLTRPQMRHRPMARELTPQRFHVRRVRGPCLNSASALLQTALERLPFRFVQKHFSSPLPPIFIWPYFIVSTSIFPGRRWVGCSEISISIPSRFAQRNRRSREYFRSPPLRISGTLVCSVSKIAAASVGVSFNSSMRRRITRLISAFASNSSAFGSPKSSKTLPEEDTKTVSSSVLSFTVPPYAHADLRQTSGLMMSSLRTSPMVRVAR